MCFLIASKFCDRMILMFDVVTIGTATKDVFLRSSLFKVLKDEKHLKKLGFVSGEAECFALGSKLEVERPHYTLGGGAANAAVTFARAGLKTGAVVKTGDDEAGESIARALEDERVKVFPAVDKKLGTGYSTILLNVGGERTILVYRGAAGNFAPKDIPRASLRAKWAYVSPGTMDLSLMKQIIETLKRRGAKVAMVPSKKYVEMGMNKLKDIFRQIDVVVVNREEASRLTGVDYKKSRAIFKKFDDVVPGIAVMTDGANGSLVSDGRYIYRASIFKEKALADRTGAGDAFASGFVTGLIRKNDVHYAMRYGAANATSVVEHIGAQTGILKKGDLNNKRWKYLDLDIEPL